MNQAEIYLKLEQNTEVMKEDVFLKDIGTVVCSDEHVLAKVKALKVHKFKTGEPQKAVIGITKVITLIQEIYPEAKVNNLGETDMLVEIVNVDRHKGAQQWVKVALVSMISFFGTGFTIMAYHNDIGIAAIFDKFYMMVMGRPGKYAVLEVAYSIGLAVGITVFFNHIGGRRITKDPTPIEVEMRVYENQVNQALIETAGREGKEAE